MANEVRIEGLRELNATLKKLEDRTQKRILNRAVNAGAVVIRNEARQNAPQDTGKLKRNIITAKRRAQKGQAVYAVSVRRKGKAEDSRNAFYGYFVEFGTSKMTARPFLTPAFEGKREEAMRQIAKTLGEGIDKAAKEEGVRR